MKDKNHSAFKRVVSGVLAVIMVVMLVPFVSAMKLESISDRVSDPSTMDDWKDWFGATVTNTENAGGVWTDKSVFTDASAFPEGTVKLDGENNFLVALSAIAANKTIVGYTNLPSDTVFILDISGSMEGRAEDLVKATNASIKSLLALNNHNRICVILYSSTASVLLPLDRYTTTHPDGNFLSYTAVYEQSNRPNSQPELESEHIGVAYYTDNRDRNISYVENSNGDSVSGSHQVTGGTFIQGGLYSAFDQFYSISDVTVEDGFQAGTTRIPIFVLMSDGAPTYGSNNYTAPTTRNVGTGAHTNEGMAFLTQLTAAYLREKTEEKYGRKALFYSLGLTDGISEDDLDDAKSVLDPVGNTQSLWDGYFDLRNYASLSVNVPAYSRYGRVTTTTTSVGRDSTLTEESVDYVEGAFYASDSAGLIEQFQSVVDEIIIQSRYYPTHLQGGTPDFSGYISFEDQIGEYMEVKDIKGILLGDTLFDGAMLTSKINSSADGLGTIDNPTELGDEFIGAIKTRLGVSSTKEAQDLAALAVEYRQLYYNSDDDFSNYIGWYAKADGSFHSFWHEGMTNHPADAVYINRSYGFLGVAQGNIKDSDMMYMSVQVHTNIKSGHQSVKWSIPAALVPMITYSVSLEGDSVETAKNVTLDIIEANPIRLVFETGLRSDINELNINNIMAAADSKFKTDKGYQFWTNRWTDNGGDHTNDISTTVTFSPSVENERYYFNEDTDIYAVNGEGEYEVVSYSDASDFSSAQKYYRRKVIYALTEAENDANAADIVVEFEELTAAVLEEKQQKDDGTWFIPIGTVSHLFDDVLIDKSENTTESLHYAADPFVSRTVSSYEAHAYLGNNGRLLVTPAQGIALSKSLDAYEPGASTNFDFVIKLTAPNGVSLGDSYSYILADTGEYEGSEGVLDVVNDEIKVTVPAGKTVFITGLPTGTEYTVTEVSHSAYQVKSVSVNGIYSQNGIGEGTVKAYALDNVAFTNTPIVKGSLIVTKNVTHPFGSDYDLPEGLEFDVEITLDGENVNNQAYEAVTAEGATTVTADENGVIAVKLAHGESISIHGIPEGTEYSITESNIPEGFTISNDSVGLSGEIVAKDNAVATLVNNYVPSPVTPDVGVDVKKLLLGRDFKEGDEFEFLLERYLGGARAAYVEVDRVTVTAMKDVSGGDLVALMDLSTERLTEAGTYTYVISEVNNKETGTGIAGVSYDTTLRHFSVVVTDIDMDGKLEVSNVIATAPVTVSGSAASGWTVDATFTNEYAPTVGALVDINIAKDIASPTGATIGKNGFSFSLYDENGNKVVTSTLSDAHGNALIELSFPVSFVGSTVVYTLKEDIHATPIPGMTYSDVEHTVTIEFVDNLDGTVGTVINGVSSDNARFTFTNTYEPTDAALILSGTKKLNGRILNKNEFSFSIYETGSNYSIVGVTPFETVWADHDGSFAFSILNYDTVGTKYYVIVENDTKLGGVTYDNTVYTVRVDIDAEGNALVAHSTVYANGDQAEDIIFVNEYHAKSTSVTLKGEKVLSGRNLVDGEFEFDLVDSEGNVIDTASNQNGVFTFDAIEYTEAKVYNYTVVEKDGGLGGVIYDKNVFYVTVTVLDDSHGNLYANVAYKKGALAASSIVFVNTYTAAPATADFSGIKTLTGRDLVANEFAFVLTNTGNGRVLETVYNDKDGNFAFSAREYLVADHYHYTITEENTGLGGVTYDNTVYSVNVRVTDNGQGQLVAEVEYRKGNDVVRDIEFKNSYKAAATEVTLSGKKTLNGREMVDGEFAFNLKGEGVDETVTNSNGGFDFTKLTYTEAGRYVYTVSEVDTKLGGVTYDETVYTVTVTVTDDLKGNLVAKVSIDGNGSLDFTNSYVAKSAEAVISGEKILNGREMVDGEFAFNLKGEGVDETVTNINGSFEFPALTYDKVGRYVYTVSEVNNGLGGVTYDSSIYTVTVTVTDDLEGKLVAAVEYSLNGKSVTKPIFENSYSASEVAYAISGEKLLNGREMVEGEFAFNLKGEGIDETVTNKLDGAINFSAITYTEVGRYVYTVSEIKSNLGGITYDETVYTVTVTVEDDLYGALKIASVEYSVGNTKADGISFKNEYNAASVSVTVEGNKALVGRDMNEKEFSFALVGEGVADSTENNADGSFAFGSLTFETVGVYTYTVTETDTRLGGITYDKTVYTVTVTVTDDLKGNLVADVEYSANENKVESIRFANTYSAKEASYSFTGLKTLLGRVLNADEFKFELVNLGTGESIETVSNNADGSFEFAPVTFTEANVYNYSIKEVVGELGGVTYDSSVYKIIVTVEDDMNGALKVVSVEYIRNEQSANGIAFENAYSAESVSVEFEGEKVLNGRDLAEGEFSFNLYETSSDYLIDGVTPVTVTNNSNGKFIFPKIEYAEAGIRYYVITETDGKAASITYDTTVYRIKVEVTDNLEGALVAKVEMLKADGTSAETVVFVNKYSELSVKVELAVEKTVINETDKPFGKNGFEFLLTRDGIEVGRVVTDENGNATFALTFKEADVNKTYTYVLTEVNGGISGVTYDTTEYIFEITVGYDESGKALKATVTKNGEAENAYVAEFENIYSIIEPGDTSELLPWMLLLVISGGAVITFASNGKKKRRDF